LLFLIAWILRLFNFYFFDIIRSVSFLRLWISFYMFSHLELFSFCFLYVLLWCILHFISFSSFYFLIFHDNFHCFSPIITHWMFSYFGVCCFCFTFRFLPSPIFLKYILHKPFLFSFTVLSLLDILLFVYLSFYYFLRFLYKNLCFFCIILRVSEIEDYCHLDCNTVLPGGSLPWLSLFEGFRILK
jgi:hypothetical protein